MKNFFRQLFSQNVPALVSMALLVLVPLAGSSALLTLFYSHTGLLENLSIPEQVLYFVVVAFTMSVALTPTTFIALITGFFFGWAGFPGMVAAYLAALVIARFIAERIDHGKLWAFLHRFDKVSVALHELDRQQFGLIVMTRLSPILPFALMNFVLSLMQVRQRDYLLGSLIGMLPRTTFFYLLGTQGQKIIDLLQDPGADSSYQLFVIGLILISMFGLLYFFTKAIRKAMNKKDFHSSDEK
ncbi:MAG: DedA family protein [Chitinophagaceae bacterium]|nr:MAG: DedA family protein [Chitinophagaceae bacterium]